MTTQSGKKKQPATKQTSKKYVPPPTTSRPELLTDGSDLEFRRLVHNIFVYSSRSQEIRGKIAGMIGLTGIGYAIMMAIIYMERLDRKSGINQIAAHLHLSGSLITSEVNKLVAAGLVDKAPHPKDRRRVILSTTEHAHKEMEKIVEVLRPVSDLWFGTLSADDFLRLSETMETLAAASDRALKMCDLLIEQANV